MTPGDAATGAVVSDVAPTLTAAPEVTAEATLTFTPVFSTPTPSPVPAGATPVAGAPTESSSTVPGQVSEDQGLVVTTASKRSKYYYVRSDTGWHRIHSTNRVWFMNVDDLLRAFPGRTLHPARTPRAATRRRATATPTG